MLNLRRQELLGPRQSYKASLLYKDLYTAALLVVIMPCPLVQYHFPLPQALNCILQADEKVLDTKEGEKRSLEDDKDDADAKRARHD